MMFSCVHRKEKIGFWMEKVLFSFRTSPMVVDDDTFSRSFVTIDVRYGWLRRDR